MFSSNLHSFGTAIQCPKCGEWVNALYADSALTARNGGGRCEKCNSAPETVGIAAARPDTSDEDSTWEIRFREASEVEA